MEQARLEISEIEGANDNRAKREILQTEERKIQEELQEAQERKGTLPPLSPDSDLPKIRSVVDSL